MNPRCLFCLFGTLALACAVKSPAVAPSPTVSAGAVTAQRQATGEVGDPVSSADPIVGGGGMWMPAQMRKHEAALKMLGLEMPVSALGDPKAHPLGAVVFFGCSASFVSPDGLMITNHHCVTRALQYHATKQNNTLEEGYLAKSRVEEKWNGPGAHVYVTQSQTDVTQAIRVGLSDIVDPEQRYAAVESRTKQLVAQCESKRPHTRCQVAPFFGGAQYSLVERLELKDIRLVYAPHRAIGAFGGEVDNWQWPRHAGDFAFFRAYVNKQGQPAEYAKDNVPYQPPHHLRVAQAPLAPGDLVWVAGYPGRTEQLKTPRELEELVSYTFPRNMRYCEDHLTAIAKAGKASADARLKGTPAQRGLNNWLKFMRGARAALSKGGVARLKAEEHERLQRFVSADRRRNATYASGLAALDRLLVARERTRERRALAVEFQRASPLLSAAISLARLAKERAKVDGERKPKFQHRNWPRLKSRMKALDRRFNAQLDQARIKLTLERAFRTDQAQSAWVKALFGSAPVNPSELPELVTRLTTQTGMAGAEQRLKWFEASFGELIRSPDVMIQTALRLLPLIEAQERADARFKGELLMLRPNYYAALREFRRATIAPDANATLRVTYGTVKGYSGTAGAKQYAPFTKASQILDKDTGRHPFDSPRRLLAAVSAGNFGRYTDARLGEVPVNFLADLHITGGNSGSPTLNARGELVGLAFDGNYEAMGSDWQFLPQLTRSIHVDIRYVLWVMDAVDGADHLLREMGIEPHL